MKLEKHNVQVLTLTEKEREAFEIVDKIINTFQKNISENDDLCNELTGEIVRGKELMRVRGILSFFAPEDEPYQIISIDYHEI